jgi:hypothetical protein
MHQGRKSHPREAFKLFSSPWDFQAASKLFNQPEPLNQQPGRALPLPRFRLWRRCSFSRSNLPSGLCQPARFILFAASGEGSLAGAWR